MALPKSEHQREWEKFKEDPQGYVAVRTITSSGDYAGLSFCGTQTTGGYTYIGFKQRGTGSWKIMRLNDSDDSDVDYAYGTTGFSTAWASPASQSYALPSDS